MSGSNNRDSIPKEQLSTSKNLDDIIDDVAATF
jgi:hypothetical protein